MYRKQTMRMNNNSKKRDKGEKFNHNSNHKDAIQIFVIKFLGLVGLRLKTDHRHLLFFFVDKDYASLPSSLAC